MFYMLWTVPRLLAIHYLYISILYLYIISVPTTTNWNNTLGYPCVCSSSIKKGHSVIGPIFVVYMCVWCNCTLLKKCAGWSLLTSLFITHTRMQNTNRPNLHCETIQELILRWGHVTFAFTFSYTSSPHHQGHGEQTPSQVCFQHPSLSSFSPSFLPLGLIAQWIIPSSPSNPLTPPSHHSHPNFPNPSSFPLTIW